MKRFILPAVALVLTMSATARTATPKTVKSDVKREAVTRADETWKDLGDGVYSDFVLSNLYKGYFNDPITVKVQESEQNPGVYRLVNPWPTVTENSEYNYLIVDARDPEYVKIPDQRMPMDDPNNGETYYCSYTYFMTDIRGYDPAVLQDGNPTMVPVLEDNVIKFTKNSVAVMWPTCNTGIVADGEWTYTNMEYEGYIQLPGGEVESDWKFVGQGTMYEGFICTVFEGDVVPHDKDVDIYEDAARPGYYRIVGAFTDSSDTARDLIIDATDPNFCRIHKQNIGIETVYYGWTYIFSVSENGDFADYDDMVYQYPEWADRNITLDDKGFNIPKTSVLIWFPDYDETNVLVNSNAEDSYIHFSRTGVEDAVVTPQGAPEYYTLQGVRVANPQKGEIVIVRQGGKTYKAVVR